MKHKSLIVMAALGWILVGVMFLTSLERPSQAALHGDFCAADLNGDGSVNATDLLELLAQWGTCDCPAGLTNCDGQCVDLNTDMSNCGGCGIACGPNQSCDFGLCLCQPGFEDCDGNPNNGCEADLMNDPFNCGGCGNACPPGFACQNGACVLPPA